MLVVERLDLGVGRLACLGERLVEIGAGEDLAARGFDELQYAGSRSSFFSLACWTSSSWSIRRSRMPVEACLS